MDVTETETNVLGSATAVDPAISNGESNMLIDDPLGDDGRSSSLSEIDDVSEHELSDVESHLEEEGGTAELDSEAETERIEDSPHHVRTRSDIMVSAGRYENSPSKLAQSTTYDELEDDDDQDMDETPSKARRSSKSNGLIEDAEETPALEDSEKMPSPPDLAGKKRKRLQSGEDVEAEASDDEPLRKRRASVKSDLGDDVPVGTPLSREATEDMGKPSEASQNGTPADETQDLDASAAPTRGRKGKKGKRKGRRVKEMDDETENGGAVDVGAEGAEDDLQDDDEVADGAEEGDDAEAAAKSEEEMAKKIAAIDALSILEKEFSTLRDKIYDERIAKLDRELEQLTSSQPTHPELLRQLECVERYRDGKIHYEHTLFKYRLQSLLNRSLAERAQIHSTSFQRIRDARERHSAAVSKQFYAIQHDRFKTEDISAHHFIPFPLRRSQQISQQTAYNQEVSVMSGVAKYVGFPAAPTLSAARQSEIDEDFEKMGISIEPRPVQVPSSAVSRGGLSVLSSALPRNTSAEETFQEPSTWANPQYHQAPRQNLTSNPMSFATPAAQKHAVDIHAPNGSASTIADNASAANSSTANTPYGTEQEQRLQRPGQFSSVDYDALDRKSGFRSQSSSPLDMRKAQPTSSHLFDSNRPDGSRHPGFSPPSRMSIFGTSKRAESPPLSSKPLNAMHSAAGIITGSGSGRMIAR